MRWAPYVPVAKRREKALKKMQKLKKQGHDIQPIEIEGRTIARTFWGKAWCEHMESFCDDDNRLPRGRTYVRNGSVCHLAIEKGAINAMVSGSDIYNISISINLLAKEKWQALKNTCSGKIGSLLDLLSGKLSSGVMEVVCHPNGGLFPSAKEFSLSCDCPDWSSMCKHLAAVLYGVGSRLDEDPAQLFKLRGVNFEELIDVNQAVLDVTSTGQSKRKRLGDSALSDLFNLGSSPEPTSEIAQAAPEFPMKLTGDAIRKKRSELNLSKSTFAKTMGVSVASVTAWEAKGGQVVKPHAGSLDKLKAIWWGVYE